MRYTALLHIDAGHNLQLNYSGPAAVEQFKEECAARGAKWAHLVAEHDGKLHYTYTSPEHKAAATANIGEVDPRIAEAKPISALDLGILLLQAIKEHGNHPVMYAVPDIGTLNLEGPSFNPGDNEHDHCFIV